MYELQQLSPELTSLDGVVCLDNSKSYTWLDLWSSVNATRDAIKNSKETRWALFETDTYRFCVGLIALLSLGKNVFVPQNNTQSTIEKLRQHKVAFIGDFSGVKPSQVNIDSSVNQFKSVVRLSGDINVFTSGSTGEPKVIVKSLQQIDAEIRTLSKTWGEVVANAIVLPTVSHQHFYGLIFSTLWPLCTGRSFWKEKLVDPASLVSQADLKNRCVWVTSPAHLHRLDKEMITANLAQKVQAVFSAGAPLDMGVANELSKQLNHSIIEIFGSSETGAIAFQLHDESNQGWVPIPGVKVKSGKDNRLSVQTPYDCHTDFIDMDDTCEILADGKFRLGPRIDRIVKIEGNRIALQEIETAINNLPGVINSAVAVLTGKREKVGAVVKLNKHYSAKIKAEGRNSIVSRYRSELVNRLPAFAIPRVWRFADRLPINSQGKIDGEMLMEMLS